MKLDCYYTKTSRGNRNVGFGFSRFAWGERFGDYRIQFAFVIELWWRRIQLNLKTNSVATWWDE